MIKTQIFKIQLQVLTIWIQYRPGDRERGRCVCVCGGGEEVIRYISEEEFQMRALTARMFRLRVV